MFKKWLAYPAVRFGAMIVLLLALILAFPDTRALADEFLKLFRVQQITVIAVDFTGLEQLTGTDAFKSQFSDLVSSATEVIQEPGDPVDASDAGDASRLAGFAVRLPRGMTPSRITVTGATALKVILDRNKMQALLDGYGRDDLVLPDSIDGAELSVYIPASASIAFGDCPAPRTDGSQIDETSYSNNVYPDCVILVEIPSPTIDAPADLDVAQLAQIALEFSGMNPKEAAHFTSTVDWKSTLVVPIPSYGLSYQQVVIDGVSGTLIQSTSSDSPHYVLLWVKNGVIHSISGMNSNSQQAIDMANSLP